MKNYFLFIWVGIFTVLSIGQTVYAGEIQYAHVEDVNGEQIYVQYKGPAGTQNFVCEVTDTRCKEYGTSTPDFVPAINGKTDYINSPDGNYGVVGVELVSDTGSTTYVHTLYDTSGEVALELAIIPYDKAVSKYKFSWSNNQLVLFGADTRVSVYDIVNKTISTITPTQSELALRSISPQAKYISSYNYTTEAHSIWDTQTGVQINIASQKPAIIEFSQVEKYATYVDDVSGFQTLYIADLTKVKDKEVEGRRVFKDDFVVEDYLFFKGDLYAVGNTEDNPYAWSLYRYDVENDKSQIVANDVSYGDYIRPIGEHALSFLTIDGKNSHVSLYNPVTDEVSTISPVENSPASEDIKRSVVRFENAYGVLYEPKDPPKKPDLFVWLHGGPERQTSFGYHSYLSYAVYDELLERLVESGAYVLKLDYTGSYGYGKEFHEALNDNIGVKDVEDVVEATRKIQRDFRIDDTYLIGNSYGGYLGPKTLVENTKYFDGAIAINGVFDWLTLLERIPSSPFKSYFKGLPELEDLNKNFDLFEQASIIKDLPDIKKQKILLIYGENDSTVPVWQTREFFYNAKSLDKNVDLLKLENEDHIIRQRKNLDKVCEFIADELFIKKLQCK